MSDLGLSKDFVQVSPGRNTGTARVSTDELGNATEALHLNGFTLVLLHK